jgi:hypothetical protein
LIKLFLMILVNLAALQLTAQVTISEAQTRRILEVKDSLDVYKKRMIVKDKTIELQDKTIDTQALMVSSFNKVVENDSINAVNTGKALALLEGTLKDAEKENKKSNTEKVILKIAIGVELLIILLLSL